MSCSYAANRSHIHSDQEVPLDCGFDPEDLDTRLTVLMRADKWVFISPTHPTTGAVALRLLSYRGTNWSMRPPLLVLYPTTLHTRGDCS